jgi:hypothetical protein
MMLHAIFAPLEYFKIQNNKSGLVFVTQNQNEEKVPKSLSFRTFYLR